MSTATAQVAYDGELFRGDEPPSMDVRDLAPALLKLGQLCERANILLNGGDVQVSVRIRADFRSGSFEVVFRLVQSLRRAIQTLLGDDRYTTDQLLDFLLRGTGENKVSVLGLFKRLLGRVPQPQAILEDGSVKLEDYDGLIPPEVWRLYVDGIVRTKVDGVLEPLANAGIDRFDVRENGRVVNDVTKEEFEAIRDAIANAEEGEIASSATVNLTLDIRKVPLAANLKWNLALGGQPFPAEIKDEDFLQRHRAGLTEFSAGDALSVRVQQVTRRTEKGLRTKNEIIKVIEHIHQRPDEDQLSLSGG